VIRPLSPGHCEVTLVILLDLGGTIPSSILKFAATNGPLAIAQVRNFLPRARVNRYIDEESFRKKWAMKNSTLTKGQEASTSREELTKVKADSSSLLILQANELVEHLLSVVDSPGWSFVKEVDGVKICSKDTGNDRSALVKGEAEINASPLEILALMNSPRKEWDPMLSDWRIIEEVDPVTQVRFESYHGIWVRGSFFFVVTFLITILSANSSQRYLLSEHISSDQR
jgi:hypothetical protein